MTWTVQLDFICINGEMPSETSHNLSRIGFECLERVKLAIPLSSSVAMWLKVLWQKLPDVLKAKLLVLSNGNESRCILVP